MANMQFVQLPDIKGLYLLKANYRKTDRDFTSMI